MKQKLFACRHFKKLAAFCITLLLLLGLFPISAFAWPVDGSPANSWYGDTIVGSDGGGYYHPAPWSYMRYNGDGTTSYGSWKGGQPYQHFVMADTSGASRWVYCIESGVNFTESSGGYTPGSGYMSLLPQSAQHGIMIASLYGWQPGAPLPVGGINENDYYMATQVILWEYQQQLRSDPHSRHDNAIIPANQFYGIIAGRPAEAAYNWILGKIATHSTVPSFTAASAGSAPVHELKWDTVDKVYRLTLTDTNNLNIDLIQLAGSGITVSRGGNKYTFTSTKMIMNPVTHQYRKNVPEAGGILIWGRPGFQTMMSGAQDPVSFFAKFKTETYGWANLIKTSEDGMVSGIKFTISGTDILGNKVNEVVTTGANGQVKKALLPGTYLVSEHPIDRYVTPANQYVTIESGQTSSVSFTNILKKFRVQVFKSDVDTGIVQGDASLAGAVYGIYKGDQLVDTYTTGPDGSFMTRYYVCGTDWTIRELSPSTGYLLDSTIHKIGADAKLYQVELNTTENRVTEKVIYGNVRLIKHTDDWDEDILEDERNEDGNKGMVEQPEAGAIFQLYLRSAGSYENAKPSERDLLTTDGDGFALSKSLPYGRYTVHQIRGTEGKAFIPDFTVFVCHNEYTYSYILNNDTITGRVRVEKRDAETGELIVIPGTGFRIKSLGTGEFVAQTVWYPNPITIDIFYTSDEGWLMLPEELPMGDYELYEVYAPYGYLLDGEPVPFTIDGSEAVVTATQLNQPQKGVITITKTGEVFSSVEENEGLYQPVYEVMGLPGAVYDIVADEDIITGDGTLRVAKDTVVETLTTGEDATAASGLLYLGKYRLEEKQPPFGMVLNTEPVFVELTYAGQDVEVTHTETGLYDERQKVDISLVKSIELDEKFNIGLGDEYQNLSFGLYAAVEIEALDGSVIPSDGLIEVVSIQPGEATPGRYTASFTADLPFGSYYVQEVTTDKHYILNDTQYPVLFAYQREEMTNDEDVPTTDTEITPPSKIETPPVVEIAVNEGEAILNEIIRGDIEGIKRGENPEGGDNLNLSGALIGLFRPDTEDMTEENALLTTISAEDGAFCFEDIPFGHWVICEIAAPEGYTISSEFHHIYIGVDGQLIEIRIENTLIRGSVQLIKTEAVEDSKAVPSEDGNPFIHRLPGAVFELYEDTDGDTELGEDDVLLGELEETDIGFHQATNLFTGGYFVKEKEPPQGCILDENAYYFAIAEDGQMVVIENGEPGWGFVNEAYRGDLRIMKDSVDERKEGFAFEVKSADDAYRETFTAGSTGIIEVTGLRIGKYTVRELPNRASSGYILPDDVVIEVLTGETVVIQFYNDKPKPEKPKSPEPEKPTSSKPTPPAPTPTPKQSEPVKPVPQTSDNGALILWVVFLGATTLGGVACTIVYFRSSRKTKKRLLSAVATFSCFILVAGSTAMVVKEVQEYKTSGDVYQKLAETVVIVEEPQDIGNSETANGLPVASTENVFSVDFNALQEQNPDVAAWLLCKDTAINYPVVQGNDNNHYLRRLYDGTPNKSGCLFMDFESPKELSGKNTIIYGHNMLDGAMFAGLTEYQSQDYFEQYPTMMLFTPDGSYRVELFAAFTASPKESGTDNSPWRLEFETEEEYAEWQVGLQSRSVFQSNIELGGEDKVLTLSTCINSGRDRFIVMGRLAAVL